jgi:hypothetical protein
MQSLLADGRDLASIRHPTTEMAGEARENGGRRDHRDLLADDLKDQSAEQVHGRQLLHPDVRVEIRTVIDQLGQHRIGRVQPGESCADLLRPRCRHALQPRSSRQRREAPTVGPPRQPTGVGVS